MINTTYDTYTFKSGAHEQEKYKLFYHACDNPVCSCNDLNIIFHEFNEDIEDYEEYQSDYEITVDIYKKTLMSSDVDRRADINFGKAFINDLDENDYSHLAGFFLDSKCHLIENHDMSDVEYNFPENTNRGALSFYNSIFKFGAYYYIDVDDKKFKLNDYHCLQPKCPCTDVYIDFSRRIQTDEKVEYGKELISYKVDYKKKTWTFIAEKGLEGIDRDQCMKKILSEVPNYFEILEKRGRQLKKLYEHNQKALCEQQPIIETIAKSSIGRNDPCPCGSGKKYKKCCG